MFRPRLALASLSGDADAQWAQSAADYAGCAFLGGIALDEATRAAARAMVARDRSEFLPEDPVKFVDEQLVALDETPIRPAFNVRSATLEPIREVARVCRTHDAILELNAHCRQDEMCAAGAGESLLREPARLREQVEAAAQEGATVSVKVRAELARVDLASVAQTIERAGCDLIHVDAMDSERIVEAIADATTLFVVANNGVRDRETAREYFGFGADAVSVGRASDDSAVLRDVSRTADEWFARGVVR